MPNAKTAGLPARAGWMLRSAVAIALCGNVAGCAQHALPPLPASQAGDSSQYRLGSGDKLRIDTFGETALSGEFDVSASGAVDLPLIGPVMAAGKTPEGLAAAIAGQLTAGGFLKDPKVGVQVLNYRPFYILGEVGKPGTYPYTVGLTVLNAVATAQGFSYRANTKRIFVRHANENAELEVPLTAATPVLPGDTIRIGERYF